MADTNVPSFVSSLAQPYINYIQGQVEGLTFLPSAARSNISAQISGSSSGSGTSGQGASSGAVASSGESDASGAGAGAGAASGAAVGVAYAQPVIDYIREQINSLLPASIADSITAGFPNASSSSGGSTEQSSVPAGVQNFLAPNAELRTFLSTLGNQSS